MQPIDVVQQMDKERRYLQELSDYFRDQLDCLSLSYDFSNTQIVPVVFDDLQTSFNISQKLKSVGVWAQIIRPPTVKKAEFVLRYQHFITIKISIL